MVRKKSKGRRRCEAKTLAGVRCARKSLPGKRRCFAHHDDPARRRVGRKKVEWSEQQWAAFDSMCVLTDKRHRVAVAMGNNEKTIDRIVRDKHGVSFSEYLTKRFEEGNFKLLAKQYEGAVGADPRVEDGVLIPGRPSNATMLVWLGKNRLEQKDKRDVTSGGNPILPSDAIVITKEQLAKLPTDALRAVRSVIATAAFDDDA